MTQEGNVIVRAPQRMSTREIEGIVEQKKSWIGKHLQEMAKREPVAVHELDPELEKMYREMAKEILTIECDRLSKVMGITYNKLTIRDQKSRWGSCSSQRNISLNWRLIFMHPMIARYVVIHELAHIRYMNHSREFWSEVERYMPNYQKYRGWLKECGGKYIRR